MTSLWLIGQAVRFARARFRKSLMVPPVAQNAVCFFTDPDLRPVVSEDASTYGNLIGTSENRALLEFDLQFEGMTRIWILRPEDCPGPIVLPHSDAEERSLHAHEFVGD